MSGGCLRIGCCNKGSSRARDVDSGTTDGPKPGAKFSQSNVIPMRKVCPQQHPPQPAGRVFPRQAKPQERRVDDHLSRRFQKPVTISEPSDRTLPVFPRKIGVGVTSIRSTTKSLKEQKSYNQQHIPHSTVKSFLLKSATVTSTARTPRGINPQSVFRSSPEKSSIVTSTARISRRAKAQEQNDKRGQARRTPCSSESSELPRKSDRIQNTSDPKNSSQALKRLALKTSAPIQVGGEKIKSRSAISKPLKRSLESFPENKVRHLEAPTYYISRDDVSEDFDESLGMSCPLCYNDLSALPPDDEYVYYDEIEPSNISDVAVLSCGHAFHSKCLDNVTPSDLSRDPPCFLCLVS